MSNLYQGFSGNLNELVFNFFEDLTNNKLSYSPETFSQYSDKWSYIYASLIKTKGPDMIKLSNLQNYLSEWDRPYSYGGFIRSVTIGPVRPIDPPTFNNGTTPNNAQIRKADIQATYHPFTARTQFIVTNLSDQLKNAMSVPEEVALYVAGVLQALADGINDTQFRMYKEIIHKFFVENVTALANGMIVDDLPVITDKATAITFINRLRDYKTDFMFGTDRYNVMGFPHTVTPERMRLYLRPRAANKIVDFLKLDHNMGDQNFAYSDIAGNISNYLGVPTRILNDFGGMIPMDSGNARLFPIFDADGAVTGTYAATQGGTTSVPVASWAYPADYDFDALLTEDDFGNVFPVNDKVDAVNYPMGGGYTNTFRYTEKILVAKPQSNTIFFKTA